MSSAPDRFAQELIEPVQLQHDADILVCAILERSRYSWVWIVAVCPYCGKSHHHYAGPLNGNPYRYVNLRVRARCDLADRQEGAQTSKSASMDYLLTPV